MAYALVGSLGSVSTGTTSVTPSFAQSTTAGNLLVAWCAYRSAGAHSATSSSGWSIASDNLSSNVGGTIFYKPNCGAGETAPTITVSGGLAMAVALAEFSGGAMSSPVDQTGNGFSNASPFVIGNALADAATGELYMTACADFLSKSATITSSETFGSGTATGNLNNDSTSTADHYRFAYGFPTSIAGADQSTHADNSMNITQMTGACSSFLLASAVPRIPRGIVNFQNPGIL